MKNMKKLSLALLLSVSSSHFMTAMEGPVHEMIPVAHEVSHEQPFQRAELIEGEGDHLPEATATHIVDGEVVQKQGNADGKVAVDKEADGTEVHDDSDSNQNSGGLSLEESGDTTKIQSADSIQKLKRILGDEYQKTKTSVSEKFSNFFKSALRSMSNFGRMIRDGFNDLLSILKKGNATLPESEQLSDQSLDVIALTELISMNGDQIELADKPLSNKTLADMKNEMNSKIDELNLDSDVTQALKEMVEERFNRAQAKLVTKAKASGIVQKSGLLDESTDPLQTADLSSLFSDKNAELSEKLQDSGLLDGSDDASGLFDGPTEPLQTADSSIFEDGFEDGEEKDGYQMVSQPSSRPSSPTQTTVIENALNKAFDNGDSLADRMKSLLKTSNPEQKQARLKIITDWVNEKVKTVDKARAQRIQLGLKVAARTV